MLPARPLSPDLTTVAQQLGLALPAELLPETQTDLRQWLDLRLHRFDGNAAAAGPLQPTFPYQDLPDSARLRYELVGWSARPAYLRLFAADASPFVEAMFKQPAALEEYFLYLLTDMRHSFKRGGCDWLLRRRPDNQPVGVLHLYDLSHERFGNWVPHCSVGYALAAPFRRQGYGYEALYHLLGQAARLFDQTEARALSATDNLASQALLRKVGFSVLEERAATKRQAAELLWTRELSEFR